MRRFLFVFSACLAGPAWADDADRAAVLDQVQAKFSLCVAYYSFARTCGEAGETARRLGAVRRRSEALAGAIPLSESETALRLELGLAAQASLSGGCQGLPTLEARHGRDCEALSSAPD